MSLPARWARYVHERHGPELLAPILAGFGVGYGSGAHARAHPRKVDETRSPGPARLDHPHPLREGVGVRTGPEVGVGAGAVWAWYLMLRVLDDVEDAAADAVDHPDRPLGRGDVSRADLLALAGVAAAAEGTASWWLDGRRPGPVTGTWLASLGFLGAAAADFGAPGPLARRPRLRAALRAPASALPMLWCYAMGARRAPTTRPAVALAALMLGVVVVVDTSRRGGAR